MKREQVAVQLFTVRDSLKTPEDVQESLKKISDIGFAGVELFGGIGMEDESLAESIESLGLKTTSIHIGGDVLFGDDINGVVERLNLFNTDYAVFPYPGGYDLSKLEEVSRIIEDLKKVGKKFSAKGKALAYHNHQTEFIKINGLCVLDWIFRDISPEYLLAELDTYWVQFGGADPVTWCEKMVERLPLLHLKDYQIKSDGTATFAELGEGNLDFVTIIEAARDAETEWYIVEQDSCDGDPFEAIEKSWNYLNREFL